MRGLFGSALSRRSTFSSDRMMMMSMCERALTPATLLGRTNCCSGHRIGTLQFLPSNIVSAYIHFTKYIGYVYPVCYLTLFACLFDFTQASCERPIENVCTHNDVMEMCVSAA